ncbi:MULTISPECIES: stage II sporulation protein D [Clostridium]|uniref:stage II sporulation protein D n=1 Tax=Clostridium TaxID=1485 RepID=UPI000824BB4C|nr:MULTISPECIES: stage II sporulation protein D [Clostridium]PJI09161.1 stage II sporulation protein D [Clostridium sp. CT7]
MVKKLFMGLVIVVAFIFSVSIFVGGVNNKVNNKVNGNVTNNTTKTTSKRQNYRINNDEIDVVKKDTKDCDISVYMSNERRTEKINLEEYIKGVVSSEMPVEFNIEALKAQAVAARTFAVCHMEEFGGRKYKNANGADVVNTVQCQVYTRKEERLKTWPKDKAQEYWNKISNAVDSTEGEVITYKDKIITEPYYFSISSGKTENIKDVMDEDKPYLKSVSSPGEEAAPKYKTSLKMSYSEFVNRVNSSSNRHINTFQARFNTDVVERNDTGSVRKIKVGNSIISGSEFRSITGINSTNFTIKRNISNIEFDCTGYGHGIGMSQWGAKAMADKGSNYIDIIKHYYTGVDVKKLSTK